MKRLLFFAFILGPVALTAQRKEDILSIQRDVAALQDQVKQLQKSQDDKFAALQSMLQQAVEATSHLSGGLTALQRDVDSKLNDQQGKLVAPVATLGSKVDQMGADFSAVATNVAELVRRMSALDAKLADMSAAIRTLPAPPQPPPPGPGVQTVPPAMTAQTSYENAFRDYSGGKNELALQEFFDYVKNFKDTENAPNAQYYIGYIYYNNNQFEDAAQAFDAVLKFPENEKSADALYFKAVSLQKSKQLTEATAAYKQFIARYPRNDHVEQAHRNLRAMGMEAAAPGSKKSRK